MSTSTERARAWRAKHPDEYRERQRALMAKRRGAVPCPTAPAVDAVADSKPIVEPVGRVDVPLDAPLLTYSVANTAIKTPVSNDDRLATLLATGRAKARTQPEPVPEPDSTGLPYAVPPQGFDAWDANRRAHWVQSQDSWRGLLGDELAQERVDERLTECRTSTGRRKL